ncbi:tetratricopeptide repeat protein [Niveispirillum irakense]|uniref:O-linked N-acetylglucosamine transferase, SPINDLY family protein n=1 Tax=Niveispirillum irakense TaxID=34011 RepID=UPI001FE22824|nr:tetratricopeptide repeat protein [Niveispirillum irakense]
MTDLFAAALDQHRAGNLPQAENLYRALLAEQPNHAFANNNLAILLRAQRRWEEAVACYRRALANNPEDAQVYNNLTCVLSDMGQEAQAARVGMLAVSLRPDYAEAWFNLGNIFRALGDGDAAKRAYHRAIRLKPDRGEAYSNLGDVHKSATELTQAAECYRTALRLQPNLPQPYVNLGEVLKEQGRVTEAITLLQQGLERHPHLPVLHSNLLFALHYSPHVPPEVIFRAHRQWGERHAAPLAPAVPPSFTNDRSPDRRLRIGYVSPDFCGHAVSCFLEPLLRGHDRSAVEIFCYPISRRSDETTARFQSITGHWVPLTGLTDEEAAARIRADAIDILVDVAGHTCDCRPLIFARRAAPVQVSWLGYPDGTGMAAMDYRLTDAIADPPGVTDRWHVEKLVRLENGFLCFRPARNTDVSPDLPARRNGHVTFGSFNNNAKITAEVVAVWAALLQRVPDTRLVLKSRAFGDPATHARYIALFAGHGITADRIDLRPHIADQGDHLRAYDGIDIALDPFPYNGTTTSCEALWMGVPVVTLQGSHHVARVTASILHHCGLDELVAVDTDSYIGIAATLAASIDRLAALRRDLRQRMQDSPLCAPYAFAATVEKTYQRMWRDWCQTSSAGEAG